ncbi:MAG: SRPBCC family protein [Bacteroidota bacterium]
MKLLKLAVISLVCLFALATGISALLPSKVLVSRAVNINAPAEKIITAIKDIRQWKHWVEGMNDRSVHISSASEAAIGKSTVRIVRVTDSMVVSEWISSKNKKQVSTIQLINQPRQKLTIVQWQFEQSVGWLPWEKLGTIMNDKILGPMMEKNLEKLRQYMEAQTGNL